MFVPMSHSQNRALLLPPSGQEEQPAAPLPDDAVEGLRPWLLPHQTRLWLARGEASGRWLRRLDG